MSNDNKCFICEWTGHFGHHSPDALCYGCDQFDHFAWECTHKIPPSGTPCHHGRSHLKHWYTHNWRDRSHSYYGPRHRRHYSNHSPTPIHTTTEARALEGTPHSLLPATAAAHAALQPMDPPITPCATITTGTVTPHPTLPISPGGAAHTTSQTEGTLSPAAPTTQLQILSPGR